MRNRRMLWNGCLMIIGGGLLMAIVACQQEVQEVPAPVAPAAAPSPTVEAGASSPAIPRATPGQAATRTPETDIAIEDLRVSVENRVIEASIVANVPDVEYAFYIIRDGEILHKQWYSDEAAITYPLDEPGSYRVQGFIRRNGKSQFEFSETFPVD